MSNLGRDDKTQINALTQRLRDFALDRDWDRYHSPKNIAMALSVEVAELMELLQWKSDAESREIMCSDAERVKDEVGDITIYLLLLCDKLGLDPLTTAFEKMVINERKYPVEKCKGDFIKYSQYKK